MVSAKGGRNTAAVKSLINYLIALTVFNCEKGDRVLEYVRGRGDVPGYLAFFDGVNDVRVRRRYEEGVGKLEQLGEESVEEKSILFCYF